jgi:hypothetical protein
MNDEVKIEIKSPQTKKRVLENKLENAFTCCGYMFDKRCLNVGMQMTTSLIVLGMSCIQLINGVNSEDKVIYVSLITSILGYWTPSPTLHEK